MFSVDSCGLSSFCVRHQWFGLKGKLYQLDELETQTSTRTYTRRKLWSRAGLLFLPREFCFSRKSVCCVEWLPFWEWFEVVAAGGGFAWQLLLPHVWHLTKWLPKPRGPHRAWGLPILRVLPRTWGNTGPRAWWLCCVDEVWFAIAELLGVSSGLLQKLAGLLTLHTGKSFSPPCGGGKYKKGGHIWKESFQIYQGINISTACLLACLFKPKITKLEIEVNQNPTEFLSGAGQHRACLLGISFKMESSSLQWGQKSLKEILTGGVLWVTVYLLVYILVTKLANFLFFLVNIQKVFFLTPFPHKIIFVIRVWSKGLLKLSTHLRWYEN